jgi:hypothetical protein
VFRTIFSQLGWVVLVVRSEKADVGQLQTPDAPGRLISGPISRDWQESTKAEQRDIEGNGSYPRHLLTNSLVATPRKCFEMRGGSRNSDQRPTFLTQVLTSRSGILLEIYLGNTCDEFREQKGRCFMSFSL